MLSNFNITLSKKDALKIIKSVSQQLREKGDDSSKVVHQLDDFKEKYIELFFHPVELDAAEIKVLERSYKTVPVDVVTRKIKQKASDELHRVMSSDLTRLLEIQLTKNNKETGEDKQHLDNVLTELEAFSQSLNIVLHQPKCTSFTPWKGAELLVMGLNESSDKEDNSSWKIVKTAYPNQLSFVISEVYFISEHFIDYMNKYWFLSVLGDVANSYEGDGLLEVSKSVIDAGKDNVRQLHHSFIEHKKDRVARRDIKLFG